MVGTWTRSIPDDGVSPGGRILLELQLGLVFATENLDAVRVWLGRPRRWHLLANRHGFGDRAGGSCGAAGAARRRRLHRRGSAQYPLDILRRGAFGDDRVGIAVAPQHEL